MKLLLIRHGETVDNVAALYAGHRDSALTKHGVLQANRLGAHLAATDVKVSHIFSSDLQRAANTAEAVRAAQPPTPPKLTRLEILREQNFGFYEGRPYSERARNSTKIIGGEEVDQDDPRDQPGFEDVESKPAMAARMDIFVDRHLVELFTTVDSDKAVVVVAHGIILSHLWRAVLKRFHRANVHVVLGGFVDTGRGLEHLGGWSNTGYLDLDVKPHAEYAPATESSPELEETVPLDVAPSSRADKLPVLLAGAPSSEQPSVTELTPTTIPSPSPTLPLPNISLVVKVVNSQEHLKGLKKTRGGIGSLKHDSNQRTVDSFFTKKQRTE